MVDVESILAFLVGGGAIVGISFSPIGRALADRLRHGKTSLPTPELDPAVYEDLDRLRVAVNELQERADFAERMLIKPADSADSADSGAR